MPQSRVSVLLVEDHPLTRDGLRLLLSADGGFDVCGEAGTLAEAVAMAAEKAPDLILLDLSLPDGNGLQLLEAVCDAASRSKVLVFSGREPDSADAVEAFRLGAAGFVGKPTPGDGVLAAIRRVLAGKPEIPAELLFRLIHRNG